MGHVRPLLLVVAFAAAAMATSEDTPPAAPLTDIPPFPAPADIPSTPPCLQDLTATCAAVYQDSSMMEPCCIAIKKLFKSDPTCICNAIDQASKTAKQYGLNYTADGAETFRQCKMTGSSCDRGNAAPNAKSIGAFHILLLLPLFFML